MRRATSAIVGLGMTVPTRGATEPAVALAVDALAEALLDAGLQKEQIDGVLIGRSPLAFDESLGLNFQMVAGLQNLRLLNHINANGTTAAQMVQIATLAIEAGLASCVACVFADTPVNGGRSSGEAFASGGRTPGFTGIPGLEQATGLFGAVAAHALVAQRHMDLYGTTSEDFAAVALADRAWAASNGFALKREPLTLDGYLASPFVVEPFRILDCALPVNGGVAVIVASADVASMLPSRPVYVLGMGQGHPGDRQRAGQCEDVTTGAAIAGPLAFAMAGIGCADVQICEFYDAFTLLTLVTLEDYGFCVKGEGGAFVAGGRLAPGGALPTNTGGGHLSGSYLQGMTPLAEAILQARGSAKDRQLERHDAVLVSGSGGRLDQHATLILSPRETFA
jgi:acetyl-CoA acetyltransferase